MLEKILLIALCGLGTFLLRYLPLLVLNWQSGQRKMPPELLLRAINGTGPAAIAALLLLSLMPMLDVQQPWQLMATLAGVVVVCLVKRLSGSLALSIILGALLYGLLMQLGQGLS